MSKILSSIVRVRRGNHVFNNPSTSIPFTTRRLSPAPNYSTLVSPLIKQPLDFMNAKNKSINCITRPQNCPIQNPCTRFMSTVIDYLVELCPVPPHKKAELQPKIFEFLAAGKGAEVLMKLESVPKRPDSTASTWEERKEKLGKEFLEMFEIILPLGWYTIITPKATLELIYNTVVEAKSFPDSDGRNIPLESPHIAINWLHNNHPKILLYNIQSFAVAGGSLYVLPEILYRLLQCEDQDSSSISCGIKMISKISNRRCKIDPDYKLLHEKVCDLFVENLKNRYDLQEKLQLKDGKVIDHISDDCDEDYECLQNVSEAEKARVVHATLLCESVARKLFPGDDQASYPDRVRSVRNWLINEHREEIPEPLDQNSAVETYLKEVEVSGESKIVADALLPHEITSYANDGNVSRVAELQWKAMVEDIRERGRKGHKKILENCLAVCDINSEKMDIEAVEVSTALGLLVSELSEEPWKGKMMNFRNHPRLYSTHHFHDLASKCRHVRKMKPGTENHFEKVFDLILEVAVDEKLKPEQMIKKIFVFTHQDFDECKWQKDYEAIQRKFKRNGYGDSVPHLVFWTLLNHSMKVTSSTEPGVTELRGLCGDLVKYFLDNDGEFLRKVHGSNGQ